MITKEEYIRRFVATLKEHHQKFFTECAEANWEVYKEEPDNRTPEEQAVDEMDCWDG
jgi:cation transport regulator ChaB